MVCTPHATADILNPAGAAEYVGLAATTLRNMRSQGRGPRFARAGGRIRYRRHDLDRWLDAHSTDPEARR